MSTSAVQTNIKKINTVVLPYSHMGFSENAMIFRSSDYLAFL